MGNVIEEIKRAVDAAAHENRKIAMFHFQVLKNAEALEGVDSAQVCVELGVPPSYSTEFTKMISLAKLMREHGVTLRRQV